MFTAPPASLMADCEEPKLVGDTNGSVVQWGNDLKHALRSCNKDKAGLREWATEAAKAAAK